MTSRGIDLGRRFKAALDEQELRRKRTEEDRKKRLAEGRRARQALLADLEAFGKEVGHLVVQRRGEGLLLRAGDRSISFDPMGATDRVRVEFDGMGEAEHRLYREEALQMRWVWAVRTPHGDNRVVLFDDGLEELMVNALGLPRPGPAP